MNTPSITLDETVPSLESGVTVLHQDSRHSAAFHRVALNAVIEREGLGYWLDCRNNASTFALNDFVDHPRQLRNLRIARAFTAYQYHALVRSLAEQISPNVSAIVSPVPADLYRDDDIPEPEDTEFLRSAVAILEELAAVYNVPVLLSTASSDTLGTIVEAVAEHEIEYDKTDLGYRFESEGFQTKLYWQNEWWQTTIPYWVDMFGAVEQSPFESAYEHGLVDATV